MKNKIFITVLIVGLVGFLWPLSGVLADLNSWNDWDKPAEVSKLVRCFIFSLVAMAGAMGIDVGGLIKQYLPNASFVSQAKVNEINSSSSSDSSSDKRVGV